MHPIITFQAKPQQVTPLAPRLLSVAQTCSLLGIGRTNFYGLVTAKKVATVKLGRRTLVRAEDLEAFIATLAYTGAA
ncbi:MAG: helix-turn-helix domain-containing protein [Janthinobacterium lividum]